MIQTKNTNGFICNEYGGLKIRILILMLTLAVFAMGTIFYLRVQKEKHQLHYSKAVILSDYGLQQALIMLYENPAWRDGYAKTAYDEGWYQVEINQREESDSTIILQVVSIGFSGPAQRKQSMVIKRVLSSEKPHWERIGFE